MYIINVVVFEIFSNKIGDYSGWKFESFYAVGFFCLDTINILIANIVDIACEL